MSVTFHINPHKEELGSRAALKPVKIQPTVQIQLKPVQIQLKHIQIQRTTLYHGTNPYFFFFLHS